jgi:hypothetical protein
MRQLFLLLSILLISTACSNFHMEKRRYNKGFHISFSKNRANEKAGANEQKIASKDKKSIKYLEQQTKISAEKLLAEIPVTNEVDESGNESTDAETSSSESTITVSDTDDTVREEQTTTSNSSLSKSSPKTSEPYDKQTSNGLWYFTLLGIVPLLMATKKQSYRIGVWASENKSKAQAVMAGLYALGFSSSYVLGNIWQPTIEDWMLAIPMTLAGGILASDAVKKEKKPGFVKRQIASAVVNLSSFFGTFALGAQTKISALQLMDPEAQTGMEPWAATLISLLLVAAMVAAFLGIALIACELSCSGYGALALVVMAGGTFLILFLGIWAILTTFRGRSRNRDNMKAGLIVGLVAALLILIPVGVAYLIGL